jgi:ferredoxin/flavodoxin---NADP+ reductase
MDGGQLSNLYPQKNIVDLPGHDSVTAQGFIDLLRKQLLDKPNHPEEHIGESVLNFEKKDDHYLVKTTSGLYETKTILIASGMGNFTPRKVGLDGEDNYDNIMYALRDKTVFKDKKVVILGGGDSAVDMANMGVEIAADLSIVHRREEFRAQSGSVEKLKATKAHIYIPYNTTKLIGEGKTLKAVEITNSVTNEVKVLPCDILLVQFGMVPGQNNFPLEKNGMNIITHDFFMTSSENVFAIGNTINYPGKVKNITCGMGEAVVAVTKIDQIINPGKNIPVHF